MRYSERELSLQRGKTTIFDRHEIRPTAGGPIR